MMPARQGRKSTGRSFPAFGVTAVAAGLFFVGVSVGSVAEQALDTELLFVLEDLLDRPWAREPVSFRIEADDGRCHTDAVFLEGPDGPEACQIANVELWPDTSHVKSADLWFVTDLDALERREYAVRYGAEPAASARPADDLRVRYRDENTVEFTTAGFGVRLLVGERSYEQPAAPSEVPGPVRALRLADGTWFGGSDLHGDTMISAWSSKVTANGPVFGAVSYRYEYADGNNLEGSVTLYARSEFAIFHTKSLHDRPHDGFRLNLSPGLPPLVLHIQRLGHWTSPFDFAPEVEPHQWAVRPIEDAPAGEIARLTPWADWWDNLSKTTLRLGLDEQREIRIARRHAGLWVEPGTSERIGNKRVSLMSDGAGGVYLDFNNAHGRRHLQIGCHEPDERVGWRHRRDTLGRPFGAQVIPETLRLNEVLAMVLDWPESGERHPRLFMSRGEMQELTERVREENPQLAEELIERGRVRRRSTPTPNYHARVALSAYLASGGDPELAAELRLVEGLEWQLGLLGDFDRMRQTEDLATHYDLLIDSGLISEERRRVLRAQMALVGYQLADPATWCSARGYGSGNPNMHVSYTLARGVVACLLRDHPMAEEWMQEPLRRTHAWFEKSITPYGEWLESPAHYAHVSIADFLSFAAAAQHAGIHDFFLEKPLQKMGMYMAKVYTPPDPRHRSRRVTPPLGRGTAGTPWGLFSVFARAMKDTVPEYSALMQWMWRETGYSSAGMSKMGGFADLYGDRTLPEQRPDWGTERFPDIAVLFRHGVGHVHEHFLAFAAVSDTQHSLHAQEVGNIAAWFAHGKPVSMRFGSNSVLYSYMRRLMNQVTPSFSVSPESSGPGKCRSKITRNAAYLAFSRLPAADYAAAGYLVEAGRHDHVRVGGLLNYARLWDGLPDWPEAPTADGPVEWQRQVMFLRGDDPEEPHYLVLNDTILNEQPTRWHFWTLSEKLDTAPAAASPHFLNDAPGDAPAAARELIGDRFTAIGSHGVDLEFFIAAPADTPRHTLRYGGSHAAGPVRLTEHQDLLHLQLPGRGRYYTVIFPKPEGGGTPAFERLGEGCIIRVKGEFGDDYIMLSSQKTVAEDSGRGVAFNTSAGAVRRGPDGVALIILSDGRVRSDGTVVEADGPVQLAQRNGKWHLRLDHGETLDEIHLRIGHPAADTWELSDAAERCLLQREDGLLWLKVPRDTGGFDLNREPAPSQR